MMSKSQIIATYALSLALFSLAGALVYFTVTVSNVRQELPGITESISQISDKVESAIKEFEKVRDLVPPILHEVEQVRKKIPPILKETAAIRELVPPILKEAAAIRDQVPSIVEGVNKASAAIELASKEVAASRPVVADLTMQIETTTNAIPPMLDHAEQIVNKAEGIGEEAGRSAVTGVVTGVVTSPFTLVGNVGRSLTGENDRVAEQYNDTDYKLIEKTLFELCNGHDIGTSIDWNNPDSSSHGTVTLKGIHNTGRKECRTLTVKHMKSGKVLGENEIKACRQGSGNWHITK